MGISGRNLAFHCLQVLLYCMYSKWDCCRCVQHHSTAISLSKLKNTNFPLDITNEFCVAIAEIQLVYSIPLVRHRVKLHLLQDLHLPSGLRTSSDGGIGLGLASWPGLISGIFSPCLYTLTVTSTVSPPYLFLTWMLYLPESSEVTPLMVKLAYFPCSSENA